MDKISAQDYFSDALHYRAHEDMPGAILPAFPAKNFASEGLWREDQKNAFVLGTHYDFPFERPRLISISKGDVMVSKWHTLPDGNRTFTERFVIPKNAFEKDYKLEGHEYRLKPFQKKLAAKDFLLVFKDEHGNDQVDLIAKDSDLVWRDGRYDYEKNPANPGFCVPLMHGKSLSDGLSFAYNRAGILNKMPTLHTDAGLRIRYDNESKQRNPYTELAILFTNAQTCIRRDAHMLRLPIEFVSALDAHKNNLLTRARMFRRKCAQFSVLTEQARNDLT